MNKTLTLARSLTLPMVLMATHAIATTVTINGSEKGPIGNNFTSYIASNPTGVQTHVIGLYESTSDHSPSHTTTGTARVHVSGQSDTPINLVLSSYEPTNWILDGAGVDAIGQILINGYTKSFVEGIDPSKVIDKTGLGNYFSSCAYRWPSSSGGCNTPSLVSGVEGYFGSSITSFTGTYNANDISVNISAVPEGSTIAYALMGLLGIGLGVRQKQRIGATC